MNDLIKISLKSVKHKLTFRKYTFELVGYDFIIDSDFSVKLIEVNTNPCLEESSTLLKQYLPRMIDDALRLTVDTIFQYNASVYLNGGSNFLPGSET